MNELQVTALLENLSQSLAAYLNERQIEDPILIGVRTGGAWIAEAIHQANAIKAPLGVLDISFYRDDFSTVGLHPEVKPSELPVDIEGRHLVLIDDVIQTGRTTRAALNTLFDFGRPASVTLGCLVALSGHELPIRADVVGKSLSLPPHQRVKLKGPDPLQLEVITINKAQND